VDFLLERMTRQGLAGAADRDPIDAVARAVGIQAQDLRAARLGVRARTTATDETALIASIDDDRRLVRTWLMRATVHLVPAGDVRWMTELFAPMIERRFANVRWRALGLTPGVIDDAVPHAREVLAGRRLSRHQLIEELAERGIRLTEDPQAATHLLLALSVRGVTCRGPDEAGQTTFALVDDWIADSTRPGDPLAELTRRYFRAFGPATAADFTTWSGLPSGAAIAAVRDELTEVEFDGRRGFVHGVVEPRPALRLLPMFDNYVIGYRDRAALLDPARHGEVYVGGMIKATVVDDGRVIGSWRIERTAATATVEITPFERLSRAQRSGIEAERAAIERYLGRPVGLAVGR
jgi:hypothetical protein